MSDPTLSSSNDDMEYATIGDTPAPAPAPVPKKRATPPEAADPPATTNKKQAASPQASQASPTTHLKQKLNVATPLFAVLNDLDSSSTAITPPNVVETIIKTLASSQDPTEFVKRMGAAFPDHKKEVYAVLQHIASFCIGIGELKPVPREVVNKERVKSLTTEDKDALLCSLSPAELQKLLAGLSKQSK